MSDIIKEMLEDPDFKDLSVEELKQVIEFVKENDE